MFQEVAILAPYVLDLCQFSPLDHSVNTDVALQSNAHVTALSATSALTESKLVQGAKTVKDPIHRGLFCILIN